jgi:hypothetical protein
LEYMNFFSIFRKKIDVLSRKNKKTKPRTTYISDKCFLRNSYTDLLLNYWVTIGIYEFL